MTRFDDPDRIYKKSRPACVRRLEQILDYWERVNRYNALGPKATLLDKDVFVWQIQAQDALEDMGLTFDPASYPTASDLLISETPWPEPWGVNHQADPANPGAVATMYNPLRRYEIGSEHNGQNGEKYEYLSINPREFPTSFAEMQNRASADLRLDAQGNKVNFWFRVA